MPDSVLVNLLDPSRCDASLEPCLAQRFSLQRARPLDDSVEGLASTPLSISAQSRRAKQSSDQRSIPMPSTTSSWGRSSRRELSRFPRVSQVKISAGLDRQVDRIEINEAFASVAVHSRRLPGADPARVNVNGGAIALEHPIGAFGARLLVTLVHELHRVGGPWARRHLLRRRSGRCRATWSLTISSPT